MAEMTTTDCCAIPCFKEELVARLRAGLADDASLGRASAFLGLLGDPMRLRIVLALSDTAELCVCDIANVLGLSMPATSHHLRRLREAGVVTFRNDGKMAWYRLLDPFAAGLAAQARVWAHMSIEAKVSAEPGCCT